MDPNRAVQRPIDTNPSPLSATADSARSRVEVTRRRFIGAGSKLMLGATALLGGLVGFEPTAQAAINCIPGTKHSLFVFSCFQSCIGPCLCTATCCIYDISGPHEFCCHCPGTCNNCSPPRAKAVVSCGLTTAFGCCVAC
jgi:hypothetical protein